MTSISGGHHLARGNICGNIHIVDSVQKAGKDEWTHRTDLTPGLQG